MRTEYRYGQAIKDMRTERGWTQEHLAEVSGLTARTIQRLERDQTCGSEALMAVASAFGVEVKDMARAYWIAERKPLRALTIHEALDFEEAINRVNESVTVELLVQTTKCCTGSRQAFLDSEPNHRDPKNLGVVVTETGRAKFSEAGIDDPTTHFSDKTIRVRGVVIRKEKGPYIEVNEPSQIEIVN